jgi:hypothetical protein
MSTKNGGSIFVRNFNNDLPDHTAPQRGMHLQRTENLKSCTRQIMNTDSEWMWVQMIVLCK